MTSPPREKHEENSKRKKKHENNPCTFPTKDIEKNLNLISVRVRMLENRLGVRIISVRGNRCRHVRLIGLVQSLNCESVIQVFGRKTRFPENPQRLDTSGCKEVTKENRDVSGLGASEVLVSMDVFVIATRGCWAAVMAAIIRHVAAASSKTVKVDARATASDCKNALITRHTWGRARTRGLHRSEVW